MMQAATPALPKMIPVILKSPRTVIRMDPSAVSGPVPCASVFRSASGTTLCALCDLYRWPAAGLACVTCFDLACRKPGGLACERGYEAIGLWHGGMRSRFGR
jgi:hypothetical protein